MTKAVKLRAAEEARLAGNVRFDMALEPCKTACLTCGAIRTQSKCELICQVCVDKPEE